MTRPTTATVSSEMLRPASATLNRCTLCFKSAGELRRAEDEQQVAEDRTGDRCLHQVDESRAQREDRDDQLRQIAERGVEQAAERRPGVRRRSPRSPRPRYPDSGTMASALSAKTTTGSACRTRRRSPIGTKIRRIARIFIGGDRGATRAVSPPAPERAARRRRRPPSSEVVRDEHDQIVYRAPVGVIALGDRTDEQILLECGVAQLPGVCRAGWRATHSTPRPGRRSLVGGFGSVERNAVRLTRAAPTAGRCTCRHPSRARSVRRTSFENSPLASYFSIFS